MCEYLIPVRYWLACATGEEVKYWIIFSIVITIIIMIICYFKK